MRVALVSKMIYDPDQKLYKKIPNYYGIFHQWGLAYEESNGGPGIQYTTAIIETIDGQVHEELPSTIKFLDDEISIADIPNLELPTATADA